MICVKLSIFGSRLRRRKLGEPITVFHRTMPRATALVLLPVDLADHYSQMAAYLRLNGILPPSAQPRK